jgi:putative transposase
VNLLVPDVGVASACRVMNIDRSLVYRQRAAARHLVAQPAPPRARPRPPLALSELERWCVLDALNSERFANCSPRQTYATLLDEGVYLGSVRTMYRLLAGADQVRERRRQLTHPSYTRPELLAVQPNEVWSWDITKLSGPGKSTYFHLYVILNIFSRYVRHDRDS